MRSCILFLPILLASCTLFVDEPADPADYDAKLVIRRTPDVLCTIDGEEVEWEKNEDWHTHTIRHHTSISVVVHAEAEAKDKTVYYRNQNSFTWKDIGPADLFPDGYPIYLYKTHMRFEAYLE